jgi:cytochrome b subunit of formate dehydrogenase
MKKFYYKATTKSIYNSVSNVEYWSRFQFTLLLLVTGVNIINLHIYKDREIYVPGSK